MCDNCQEKELELNIDAQCSLYHVNKPYQYVGGEHLSVNKDWESTSVRIAFAFPDKYEIAISNLGQRILYGDVNRHEDFLADRVYAPDFDYRQILKDKKIPLYSLEAKKELKKFDMIGFSAQYELAYPTMLEMLNLAEIGVKRSERCDDDPIIIVGGPCSYNPKPMSDFIDLFMIGDGEDLIIEMMSLYKELKSKNLNRHDIIVALAGLEGVYSPELNNKTRKRIVQLDNDNPPVTNPIPYSSSVHDRAVIEIRRGCGRMCRFCQPGHVTLPIRERKAEDIIDLVKKTVKQTGYNEYSLLSLSSNDYTNIEEVIEELSCELNEKKVSASLPSQRIDKYSAKLAHLVQGVRKSTVTLAPEAGSQRLRNVINKNLTEDQILDTIFTCYKNGFTSVKLYFILGLPTETYEDLDEMAELLTKIKYRSKLLRNELGLKDVIKITCTISIFVPKPFTPFQWHSQDSEETIKNKINYLLEKTKHLKGVKINYHTRFVSKVEAALTRGDESLCEFIYQLYKSGAYMTTWDENIDFEQWNNLSAKCNISLDELAQRQYDLDEELPWDVIDVGINKDWFKAEYKKAMNAENTIPCEFKCVNCGVCKNFKVHKVVDEKYVPKLKMIEATEQKEPHKYRIKLSKENNLRYLSHLDWQNTLIKALFRSGLDLVFSQGFNPTPKISLGIALPIFVESSCEMIDIDVYNDVSEAEMCDLMTKALPNSIKVLDVKKVNKDVLSIDIIAQWALYEVEPLKKGVLKSEELLYIRDKISSDDELIIEKKNKKGITKLVNIKPSIKSVDVVEDKIQLVLKVGQNADLPSVKADVVLKMFRPEIEFKIKRTKFFDENLNEI
ncbi:MAG: TIGR03960 family B12-binding radical SAM protein [Candidatus Gastranaerophilales bacterium]|nr:TIGR03960 family B12-binding radical SAM protein [Candidatus Gastranaerophilales bacterium]